MSLSPKVKFKNKVYDSNYHEINPFSLFGWNSISGPLSMEIDFLL
jgi:hypothetical protein